RQITLKAHEEIMASQEVGHSTWFRSCIPIISVNECAHGFLGCPHVGYSLMGLASMTVTSPCSAARQMVSTMAFPLGCTVGPWFWMDGWFRYPLFLQSQGP
ncbi:hypothetical protein ACQXYJ_12085, partial [Corynebacterium diphtheriae]